MDINFISVPEVAEDAEDPLFVTAINDDMAIVEQRKVDSADEAWKFVFKLGKTHYAVVVRDLLNKVVAMMQEQDVIYPILTLEKIEELKAKYWA